MPPVYGREPPRAAALQGLAFGSTADWGEVTLEVAGGAAAPRWERRLDPADADRDWLCLPWDTLHDPG
jgi:hypothetical protein